MTLNKAIYWIHVILVISIVFFTHAPHGGGIAAFLGVIFLSVIDLSIAVILLAIKLIMKLADITVPPALSKAIAAFSLSAGLCFLVSFPLCFAGNV